MSIRKNLNQRRRQRKELTKRLLQNGTLKRSVKIQKTSQISPRTKEVLKVNKYNPN
jgi:5-bromo-4-chloroindolyl phosphate hydrolysis protein